MRGHWFAWLAAQEDGDGALARQKTDEILKYAQKIGIRRLTDLALSATLLGRKELLSGKAEPARLALESAVRLDPDLPEARWAEVVLIRKTGGLGDLPGAVFRAVRATLSDTESRRLVAARAELLGVLALATAGVALALILILAHSRRYLHDLCEVAARFVPGPAVRLVAAALFFAPLLFAFDVVWLGIFLVAVLLGYATFRQRIAVAVGVLAIVPLFPVVYHVGNELALSASPLLRGAEALKEARYDQRVLDELESVKNVLPDDPDVRFLLGRLYQALGQNDRAVTEYTMGAQVSSSEARCLVNRGNIRFVDGDFGSAQEDFQEALKRDGRNVAARYNLSLVFAETFRTVEAADLLREARALDGKLVQRYQDSPTIVKVVSLDVTPRQARAKIEALASDPRSRRILGHFRLPGSGSPLSVPVVPGLLLALVAGVVLDQIRGRGRGYSSECQKCGRTFCRLCKPPGESALLCSQCIHVYLKKDGVAIETKLQKVEEVKRRRALEDRLRAAANVLLPGTAAFLDSRVGATALSLLLFSLGLLAAFGREAVAASPRPGAVPLLGGTIFWGAVAAAGWSLGQLSGRKRA